MLYEVITFLRDRGEASFGGRGEFQFRGFERREGGDPAGHGEEYQCDDAEHNRHAPSGIRGRPVPVPLRLLLGHQRRGRFERTPDPGAAGSVLYC